MPLSNIEGLKGLAKRLLKSKYTPAVASAGLGVAGYGLDRRIGQRSAEKQMGYARGDLKGSGRFELARIMAVKLQTGERPVIFRWKPKGGLSHLRARIAGPSSTTAYAGGQYFNVSGPIKNRIIKLRQAMAGYPTTG